MNERCSSFRAEIICFSCCWYNYFLLCTASNRIVSDCKMEGNFHESSIPFVRLFVCCRSMEMMRWRKWNEMKGKQQSHLIFPFAGRWYSVIAQYRYKSILSCLHADKSTVVCACVRARALHLYIHSFAMLFILLVFVFEGAKHSIFRA